MLSNSTEVHKETARGHCDAWLLSRNCISVISPAESSKAWQFRSIQKPTTGSTNNKSAEEMLGKCTCLLWVIWKITRVGIFCFCFVFVSWWFFLSKMRRTRGRTNEQHWKLKWIWRRPERLHKSNKGTTMLQYRIKKVSLLISNINKEGKPEDLRWFKIIHNFKIHLIVLGNLTLLWN